MLLTELIEERIVSFIRVVIFDKEEKICFVVVCIVFMMIDLEFKFMNERFVLGVF